MPRMNTVFGQERFNLAYAIIGYVTASAGYAKVDELASHFGYRQDEIVGIIKQLNNVETGESLDAYEGMSIFFDIDALEDGEVILLENHSDVNVPRLTTQQTAAISAGLTLLKQMQGFEHNADIDLLLDVLHSGKGPKTSDTILVEPESPDSDLEIIRSAILKSVAIKCDYRNLKGERSLGRVIEPLRLESRDNIWYLKGFCHKNLEVRNFRLDQMDSVVLTDIPITEEHKSLPLDGPIYQPGSEAISVIIEVEPEAYQVLSDYNASYDKSVKSGIIQATIKVSSLLTLPPMVASYGGAVRVLEPVEAKTMVREFALRALGRGSEIASEKAE